MILSDFIPDIRKRLKDDDDTNGYRFSKIDLAEFLHKAICEIRSDRTDAQYDSECDRAEFAGLWEYTESGTNTGLTDLFANIAEWDKDTYPTLYFKATSSSVITIYDTSAHRTAGSDELAHINNADLIGLHPVIADNSSGFGGSLEVISEITTDDVWQVLGVEAEIPLDAEFYLAAIHFAVYLGYVDDNEDTHNEKRAAFHKQEYINIMGL